MYIISPPRLMKRRGRVLWAMMRTQVGTCAPVHWEMVGGEGVSRKEVGKELWPSVSGYCQVPSESNRSLTNCRKHCFGNMIDQNMRN